MSLSPYNPNTDLMPQQPTAAPDLMSWAIEAGEVYKIAEALARTQFVPATLRGKQDDICAQILYGREVGMTPMVALQQIHLIDGRPSMSALSMRGLAQSKGVKFRLEESTESRCKMSAIAPGDIAPTTVTWTFDRAKKLGVTGKQNWQKQPQAMLVARATSELCRLVAAPLFLGMSYATEELRDGVDSVAQFADTTPEPEPQTERTIRRKPIKAQATVDEVKPEPVVEPEQPGTPADARTPVTENTRKALMAAFREFDMADRVLRLAYVSDIVGREIGSVNDITEDEAKTVLRQVHVDIDNKAEHWDDVEVAS